MFVAVPIMCVCRGGGLSGTYINEDLSFVKLLLSHCVYGRGSGPYCNVVLCIISNGLPKDERASCFTITLPSGAVV